MSGLYQDPVHYELLAQMTAPADLPFYRKLVAERGGPVLELGCGTGRVCLALAQDGATVTGVDRAEPLLGWAVARAHAEGLAVTLGLGDVRELDLGQRFRLVLFPYNGLNHLERREDVLRFLAAVRGHLDEQGLLVIDTFNPDPRKIGAPGERKILEYLDPHSGERITMTETQSYDAATQLNRLRWRYRPSAREDELTMRIFFPAELDALLDEGGFDIVAKLGGYDGRPFDSESSLQLTLCRVR